MPLYADLYLSQIDLSRYADTGTCRVCHVDSFEQLVERLRSGQLCAGRCPHWPAERIEAFRTAIDAGRMLPSIPSLDVPRPTESGPIGLNEPNWSAPVLITGNSQLTHDVLLAVLSTTGAPMWLVAVDTGGNTVDMSLVFKTLTPETIAGALASAADKSPSFTGRIILPGLAASLAGTLARRIGRAVEVGPVCAAELPLFFGADWGSPERRL